METEIKTECIMQLEQDTTKKEQHERLQHLAHQFQNSLISFRDSLGPTLQNVEGSKSNAQTQIKSLMRMANESALAVLSLAEKQSSNLKSFEAEANDIRTALNATVLDEKIKENFNNLSSKMKELSIDLEESNRNLSLSQTYQDLTNQMLYKMMDFINSIENGLTEMVSMLTSDNINEKLAEIGNDRLKNSCSQNDVDEILAKLGF